MPAPHPRHHDRRPTAQHARCWPGRTDPVAGPPELQQRQGAAMVAWAEIERLRARSNEIEMVDPLPADIGDDGLWAVAL